MIDIKERRNGHKPGVMTRVRACRSGETPIAVTTALIWRF